MQRTIDADSRKAAPRCLGMLAIAAAPAAAFGRTAVGANILTARMIVAVFTRAIETLDCVAVFVLAMQPHPAATLATLQARVLGAVIKRRHAAPPELVDVTKVGSAGSMNGN